MSYNSDLQRNNDALRGILDKVNELPNAGSLTTEIEEFIIAELAKRGQLKPEFANSIEECTDESKLYVLPDGYIYAYILVEVTIPGGAEYTNRADPASADWCANSRLGSSGVSEETNGSVVTNYIPCKKDDLIRVEGLNIGYLASNANARIHYLDSNKTLLGTNYPFNNTAGAFIHYDLSGFDAYKWDYKVGSTGDGSTYESFADSISFVRFCGEMETDAANVVITVNEEIKTSEPTTALEYKWANTGHAFIQADDGTSIPGYWADHLSSKIARIKELQKLGGKDCFTFVSIADLHAEQNLGKLSGLLARKIMDECNIKYALVLGDIATRHSVATEADMDKSLELGFSILKPILSDALLAQGNHDGAYSTSYGQNYSRGKIYETFSRKVGLVGDVHFCDDGYGYYIDDTANRVRYVILNPHNQLGRTDVNYFNTYRFGQSQFDLMVEALTTMPKDDWGVVFASHIPPVTEVDRHGDGVIESDMTNNIPEQGLLRNMIAAFNVRSESFSGSYDAPGTWDYVNLADVDFSNAKGNFIGYFAGHLHADCLFSGGIYNFPIVTSRCDSANENVFSNNGSDVDEVLKDERIEGTTTEQSFDVFTVNKTERKIYATKIGAGSDREISY